MEKNEVDRSNVPSSPGVYLFHSKGAHILYIGKAKNIKKRLQHYFTPKSLRKQDMVAKAQYIQWYLTNTEEESLMLETNLIRQHKPSYNNLIKGDQSYVYIKIPHEDFPNITLSRYKKNDKARYIGPKVWTKQLKQTLHILRTVLKWRSCSKQVFDKGIVCSDYFFGLCEGWCAYAKNNNKSDTNHSIGFHPLYTPTQAKERYTHLLDTIATFFDGQPELLTTMIQEDIAVASEKQHFERAAKLRDVYYSIEHITQQQHIVLASPITGIYVEIHTTDTRHIRGVLHIHEGKIVDIITGKEHRDEYDIVDVYRMIEREYAISLTTYTEQAYMQQAASMDRYLKKKDLGQLHQQISSHIHSYLQRPDLDHSHITNTLLHQLQTRYHFNTFPYSIECVDISHIGGDYTVGAITAMHAGIIDKTRRRRYKITSTDTGDDYAALEEVIIKRFTNKYTPPNVFILDGGKGQLGVIQHMMQEKKWQEVFIDTTFVALGKGKARSRKGKIRGAQEYISYIDDTGNIEQQPLIYDPADRLLIHLRDEAHRFANAYRKKRMQQSFTHIGEKTQK